jgi:hypothetical protein
MMSGKPSDILEQLNQVCASLAGQALNPPWFSPHAAHWHLLLADAINEIKKSRDEIANLNVMRESYSRLYKQIYGNDYG